MFNFKLFIRLACLIGGLGILVTLVMIYNVHGITSGSMFGYAMMIVIAATSISVGCSKHSE